MPRPKFEQEAAVGIRLIAEILEVVLEGISREIALRGVRVEKKIPPDLSPVHTEAFLVQQVLRQLISNALLAMPGGDLLTLEAQAISGRFQLSIADTGQGIAAGDLSRLFEPFFRLKYSNESAELELAACRGILQSLGGDLEAYSAGEGHGAVFTLTLPCAPPAELP